MAEHSSLTLLGKLVPIISFLLLWQFATSIAQVRRKAGAVSGSVYAGDGYRYPYPAYCNAKDGSVYGLNYAGSSYPPLPYDEANALQTVLANLGVLPVPSIRSSHCQDPLPYIDCKCPNDVCHISEIRMESFRLSGSIHKSVSNLKDLETLDLSDNYLVGPIPDSLGDLRNLTTLDLSGNQLSGKIPEGLGKLQNLTTLTLSRNFLNETIPPSLGNLSSLVELNLWSNNLTGQIPKELGNLSNLTTLRLDDNQLHGPLPPELERLRNLERLWLTSNNFNGTLPDKYSQLTSIRWFAVGGNKLSGRIPNYFNKWVNLSGLILLGNSFEGPLPQEIFYMTNLTSLWVSDLNSLPFSIPDSANLSNIDSLILRHCSINGSIPKNIGTWSWLTHLDLSFNDLTGQIPESMKNLTNLNKMFLTRNMLEGDIRCWINQIKGDLSYNNFTNKDMSDLAPNNNKINFEPSSWPSLENMTQKFCNGSKSKYHSLFINSGGEEAIIDGNRYNLDNSTSNYYVSPEKNWAYSCSGDFISSKATANDCIKNVTCGISVSKENLYKNARLCPQSLTYYGFCLRNGNYTVQLHFAEIVYAKDEDHSSKGKRVFDVYIQGKRKLQDFNIKEEARGPNNNWNRSFDTLVDNNQLKIQLFWAGKGSLYNEPALNGPLISAISVTPNFKVGGSRTLSAWKIAVITVGFVFALLLLLALLWRMGLLGDRELRESRVQIRGKVYTIKQIIDATKKFSLDMEIGRGSFGIVYKAELSDKDFVAVKKLYPQSKQEIDQIGSKQEIEGSDIYSQKTYKLENVVELFDGYSKKDLHLMIYEYMDTSLQHALFDPESTITLSWENRCNICLGMAEGLKHLHESKPMVIHRNIKPSNILLDGSLKAKTSDVGSLKAKISDVGLVKLFEEDNPYIMIGKKGNVYMAPEYATRRAITDKVDVYSFGVVLLELISGKRNDSNEEYRENQEAEFLLDRACVLHKNGRLLDLVDEKLSQTYNPEQAKNILTLAVKCVDISPTLRPRMSEVVSELKRNAPIIHNLY